MSTDEIGGAGRPWLQATTSGADKARREGSRLLRAGILFAMTTHGGLALTASAQSDEGFYARGYNLGQKLWELDPQTGAVLRQIPYVPGILTETALAHTGQRLVIQGNTNWLSDRLVYAHPADGGRLEMGPMGSPWRLVAIDYDSAAAEVRGICQDNQGATGYYGCRFDSATGQVSFWPTITFNPFGLNAMAIDAAGVAFVATAPGPRLYLIDLPSGLSNYVGDLGVPTCVPLDLAFDRAGRLWASLYDIYTGADTGLYTVDLTSYAATKVIALTAPYTGIAFGNKTSPQPYCAAKPSSISCLPTLRADGFASPTAKLGFTIHADNLNNNRTGLLFYTAAGRASTPFQGGLLCVAAPVIRSPAANTGGTAPPALDCTGTWSIDYNAMIWAKYGGVQVADVASPPPYLIPGTAIQCQWWGRDPGFVAPNNSMLSDGLEFVLSP